MLLLPLYFEGSLVANASVALGYLEGFVCKLYFGASMQAYRRCYTHPFLVFLD